MDNETWYYKVVIVVNEDSKHNPDFIFKFEEKEKMYEFVDICLENGHEVSVVKTTQEFDRE